MHDAEKTKQLFEKINADISGTKLLLDEIEGLANKTIFPYMDDENERLEEIKAIVVKIKEIL